MTREMGQEYRCAVCGRPLVPTVDLEIRDDALSMDLSSSSLLPICSQCQDDLYYGDDSWPGDKD